MSELTINTTQNVNINFIAATVGDRILASLLDLVIKAAYAIFIIWIIMDLMNVASRINAMDQFSSMAVYVIIFMPVFIYSIVLESIFEGQTFGKKVLRIKVVKIDGYQASFGDYLIRWLFRIIELNSVLSIIGIVAVVITEKTQRIGDIAAGTAVITLKNKITINSTILEEIGENYVPIYAQVIKLSDNDLRIIKDTFVLAKSKNDYETIAKLKNKIEQVCEIKNQSGNDNDFLKTVLKDYNFYTSNM